MNLVEHIKSLGIQLFAFSCDARLLSPENQKNLIASMKLCEDAKIYYQLIFTGVAQSMIWKIINSLKDACGQLQYMIPVSMEMVDIGGGAQVENDTFCHQSNRASCNKKGFYRPTTLHISPDGKVRTCMYALGLSNCGNLRQMTMLEIVKNFQHKANNTLFSAPVTYTETERELLLPYLHHYHPIHHECTRFAIIARAAEMKVEHPKMSLNEIHSIIAQSIV